METERDRYRPAWTDGRIMRCCFFALFFPGIAIGIFATAFEFSQLGTKTLVYDYRAFPYSSLPEPEFSKIVNVWISTQLQYTIAAWVMLCFFGFPLFVYCSARIKEAASKSELIVTVFICAALPALLPILVAYIDVNKNRPYQPLRGALLLFVIGISSGAWIAWQAWRSVHPEEKFFPRFSLGTLLIVVLAWGALLAVFAPK